jgi:chloride channel protein, CIC family
LLAAKLVLSSTCIGGVFAPSLFVGAMLGAVYGLLVQALFPSLHLVPSAFALVGMAGGLAGAVHAPLTAIILLFEMTGDYHCAAADLCHDGKPHHLPASPA